MRLIVDLTSDVIRLEFIDHELKRRRRESATGGITIERDRKGQVVAIELAPASSYTPTPQLVHVLVAGNTATGEGPSIEDLQRLIDRMRTAMDGRGQPPRGRHALGRRTRGRRAGVVLKTGALKEARMAAGLSLQALGEGIVSRAAVHMYESADVRPSQEVLSQLAERLGRPIDFFVA